MQKELTDRQHEQPLYPVITRGYEGDFKNNYKKVLNKMILEIGKKMIKMKS